MSHQLEAGLQGHWDLNGDCRDRSGQENHGHAHNVDFGVAGRSGKPGTAAGFDGVDASISVPDAEALRMGKEDFTVTAWVHVDQDIHDVIGDVVSKYDETTRSGLNLCIHGSASSYNSLGDSKHVHFGIDQASEPVWEDCGVPWPSNTYISSLTVFKGRLYAGITDAAGDPMQACHVFRYSGGTEWEDCGRAGDSPRARSIMGMVVHRGDLYCSTGWFDWVTASPENCDPGRVYRYAGGSEWTDCGQPGDNLRLKSLASFGGELYVGGMDSQHVYRYGGGTEWIDAGPVGDMRVFALAAHNGDLYAAGHGGEVYRHSAPDEWIYVGRPMENRQIHTLGVYRGQLFAGTWPLGKVCRYDGGTKWTDCGRIGTRERDCDEVQGLTVYNGKLYAGVLPKAEVWRYERDTEWTLVKQVVRDPDWTYDDLITWARVPSLTIFDGKLYTGTCSCRGFAMPDAWRELGRIYAMSTGTCVSYDRDLGSGWKHIAAVREGNTLRLHVDGQLVTHRRAAPSANYDLTNPCPLLIGFGSHDYFSGKMDEIRFYDRALPSDDVSGLHAAPPIAAG